jgi:oligogalacturonide lyase
LLHYPDPATELPVIRLTDPAFASGLTAPHLRQFSRRGEFLLHWSDRAGSTQAFLLDLRSGESRQLTDAAALDPSSLSFSADDKSVWFFDGPALTETSLAGSHTRVLYRVPDGATRRGFTVGSDGSILFCQETGGASRILRLVKQLARAIAEERGIDLVLARPHHAQLLYRAENGLWLAGLDGSGRQQIKTEPGTSEGIVWTPSGRSLIYLHIPDDSRELIALRENIPEDNTDREIARTSQFAAVAANGDASVFAGASRGKASAYVLLLLRVTRRELTLCEHRASDPRMVSPLFAPDSQSVFFVSDRHGKPAVYRVRVDKFVESTDGQ